MIKKLYKQYITISLFLTGVSIKINSYKLCALIFFLNIRRFKKIKIQTKIIKRVLVFPKSGGTEDLYEAFCKNNDNIIFYTLPRSFLKKVFNSFFKKNIKKDYFTKPFNKTEKKNKDLYIKFLTSTFKQIDRFLKIDGFISFNIFYYAEKYFDQISKNLEKKYIILHKESALVPLHEKSAPKIYKKNNEKSLASKISVFSNSQKKILISSGIVSKNQIEVNGCPRSDFTFRLRKIKPNRKTIIYYLIESFRSTNQIFGIYDFDWKELYDQTLNYIIKFAKKNPEIKIILKGKTGIHKKTHFENSNLPKNCKYVGGGDGEKLLSQAKIAIAFNSTVVYNILASNRDLVIPNFNNENNIKKKYLLNVINSKYFANSEKEFFEMLYRNLKTKYSYKQISKKDKEVLKYYMGNIDGKSGVRVNNLIRNALNL